MAGASGFGSRGQRGVFSGGAEVGGSTFPRSRGGGTHTGDVSDTERIRDLERQLVHMRLATEKLNNLRGEFLAAVLSLEEQIDRTIVYYFQPDELPQFIEWVLAPMPFQGKLNVLKKMLQHLGLWQEYRALWRRMDKVREERNDFAHKAFWLLPTPEGQEGPNYRFTRHHRAKGTEPDAASAVDLRSMERSLQAVKDLWSDYLALDLAVLEAHSEPSDVFWRPGMEF